MDDSNFEQEFTIQEHRFARHEHLRTEYHERRRLTVLESLCRRREIPATRAIQAAAGEAADRSSGD